MMDHQRVYIGSETRAPIVRTLPPSSSISNISPYILHIHLSSLFLPFPTTYTLKVTEQNRSTSRRCDSPASPSSPRPSRR
jgi:hypothetical protein